jgi:hypothetical protein
MIDSKYATQIPRNVSFYFEMRTLNILQRNEAGIQAINKVANTSNYKSLVDTFGEVFSGIGCIDPPYKIKLDNNAVPVITPIRKVPFALMDKLKQTVLSLENLQIIKKVEGPSEWVNPLVIVKKSDDSLRICLDPLHLNKAIKREHSKLLTFEDITSKLGGAQIFTKLDANQAFYQIKLDEASSDLCTVGTPFGRYKFLRLPYGIKCAPEVFNERFRQIFDFDNVAVYIDDILIWGKTQAEHDATLLKVLQTAKEHNTKFNLTKCEFGKNKISFMGHILSKEGVSIDPKRITAITNFTEPKEKKDVQRLLGIVNYMSKYIPNYSEETQPLRDLLKKDVVFRWEDHHRNAFQKIKNSLVKSQVLKFFNPAKNITVSVDASLNGLGACLLQDNLPVSYASKALNDSQKNQAQITKELLAIWFGLSKFHDFVFGRKVTVETDHKPLLAIINKPLCKAPARLQRILLALQRYNFHLVYKPGKDLIIADALSRAYSEIDEESDDLGLGDQVCVVTEPNISDEYFDKIKTATKIDPELQLLSKVILSG